MKKVIHDLRQFSCGFLVAIIIIPIVACAGDVYSKRDHKQPSSSHGETLPFSINFDTRGNPILVDREGNQLKPPEVKFPLEARKIKNLSNITAIQVEGSHYMLLQINGRSYRIDLPH